MVPQPRLRAVGALARPETVRIREDAWLGGVLETPAFALVDLPSSTTAVAGLAAEITEHAASRPGALYYAKFDTDRVDLVRELGRAGFFVVDVSVTLQRGTGAPAGATVSDPSVEVREVSPAEGERIAEIAGTCFRYSRFHLDPLITRWRADAVKREWVRSYLRGTRGDQLWVATLGSEPVGFLAVLTLDDRRERTAVIDLIGVASTRQGRGIGRTLVGSFVERYRRTHERLQVGTQAANLPSLALYERCGFAVARTQFVMHLHAGADR